VRRHLALAFGLVILAFGAPASADDAGQAALARMVAAEAKTTSFHVASADFFTADVVRPGDVHATIGQLEFYKIGGEVYQKDADHSVYLHQSYTDAKNGIDPFLTLMRGPETFAKIDGVVATDSGSATLDDRPVRKVTLSKAGENGVFVMWIGADDLIYALDFPDDAGKPGPRLRYSRYDALTSLVAPANVL
jgi:hypothetical protein